MKPVVIIGTGGHGREVAEIVQAQGAPWIGWLTDDHSHHGTDLYHRPILGPPEWLIQHPDVQAVIAIGSNSIRQAIAQRLGDAWRPHSAVSPHALISPRATIGYGCMIFAGAIIGPDVAIGAGVIINVAASVSHDSSIGAWSNINPGARMAGNVTIGTGAFIGMGAHVIQGRTVGPNSIIGAGSIVIRDIPASSTAVGVPAQVIKSSQPQS